MPNAGHGLAEELEWRGLVHQMTDPGTLAKALDHDSLTVYGGFDPTADSLHLGNLLQLCSLRRLQEGGHRPIFLAGGGTGMIGDPGGKTEERALLTPERLETNLAGIRSQLERFVDLSEGAGLLLDNGEWLWQLSLLEFLRDVGKHFTVNQMVAKESVRARLEEREQGISYTEFSYMLLQAYDFLHLHDHHGCTLQIGGSDQWGNITMGVDLIRKLRGAQAFGLTSPLILRADGTKFGKTESGTNVWLDRQRTSPYQMFQFLLSTDDAVVGTYLRAFTWLSRERIEELDELTANHPEQRVAARELALHVTSLVHGDEDARRAEEASRVLFSPEIASLDLDTLLDVVADSPRTAVPASRFENEGGAGLVELLSETGLCSSKGDARRQIEQGAVRVNNQRIGTDEQDRRLVTADLLHGRLILLSRGQKNRHVLLVS
jgi:tyrosyl-tRNA synthetase